MSRIDMIAPSTTTPATSRTSLSSLSDAERAGAFAGCGGVWEVTPQPYGNAELRHTRITSATGCFRSLRTNHPATASPHPPVSDNACLSVTQGSPLGTDNGAKE